MPYYYMTGIVVGDELNCNHNKNVWKWYSRVAQFADRVLGKSLQTDSSSVKCCTNLLIH